MSKRVPPPWRKTRSRYVPFALPDFPLRPRYHEPLQLPRLPIWRYVFRQIVVGNSPLTTRTGASQVPGCSLSIRCPHAPRGARRCACSLFPDRCWAILRAADPIPTCWDAIQGLRRASLVNDSIGRRTNLGQSRFKKVGTTLSAGTCNQTNAEYLEPQGSVPVLCYRFALAIRDRPSRRRCFPSRATGHSFRDRRTTHPGQNDSTDRMAALEVLAVEFGPSDPVLAAVSLLLLVIVSPHV